MLQISEHTNRLPGTCRPMSGVAQSEIIPCALPGPGSERVPFIDVASDGVNWTMRVDLVDALLPAVRRSSSDRIGDRTVETVKTGPHRTVYRLALPEGDYYLKHFRVTTWKTLVHRSPPPRIGVLRKA